MVINSIINIRKIQNIARENNDRLYYWVEDPNVPAENNFAKRELRPVVMAERWVLVLILWLEPEQGKF